MNLLEINCEAERWGKGTDDCQLEDVMSPFDGYSMACIVETHSDVAARAVLRDGIRGINVNGPKETGSHLHLDWIMPVIRDKRLCSSWMPARR